MYADFEAIVIRNRHTPLALPGPVYATLGAFDGLHKGHRALCEQSMRRRSEGLCGPVGQGSTVAITFYPHPDAVLGKGPHIPALTTLRQKVGLFTDFGIDVLYLVHFTKTLSQVRAQDFIRQELVERLNIAHLVIGPDAHVGYRREGTPEVIVSALKAAGRSAEILEFVDVQGGRVSSGRVRTAVQAGQLQEAENLLGRPYAVEARVRPGDGRGRTIGIPTANLAITDQLLPPRGVYACFAQVDGKVLPAVTNIGIRPTFGGTTLSVETHLLNFGGGDLYRSHLEVAFVAKIRDEQKFASVDALKLQIEQDISNARDLLGKK